MFRGVLAACGVANVIGFLVFLFDALSGRRGLLREDGVPIGGDFINLWATSKLVLSGDYASIYAPESFMAFQHDLIGAHTGFRLWVYPPHSLLFAWPFGLTDYYVSLAIWSVLGLSLLTFGSRRFGFDWTETMILVLSPAAITCLYFGQTGNMATGLLLIALSARSRPDPTSMLAAAVLTIKPQTGFLLPLIWLGEKRWWMIAATAVAMFAILALSVVVFGIGPWRNYLTLTAPALSNVERNGDGPFMIMIPSLFMSLRLLGMPGDGALFFHAAFAAAVAVTLVWRFRQTKDPSRRTAMALVATCLITPYIHMYDLTILVVAVLLMFRSNASERPRAVVMSAMLLAWFSPYLVYTLGLAGFPITPLLICFIFFVV